MFQSSFVVVYRKSMPVNLKKLFDINLYNFFCLSEEKGAFLDMPMFSKESSFL